MAFSVVVLVFSVVAAVSELTAAEGVDDGTLLGVVTSCFCSSEIAWPPAVVWATGTVASDVLAVVIGASVVIIVVVFVVVFVVVASVEGADVEVLLRSGMKVLNWGRETVVNPSSVVAAVVAFCVVVAFSVTGDALVGCAVVVVVTLELIVASLVGGALVVEGVSVVVGRNLFVVVSGRFEVEDVDAAVVAGAEVVVALVVGASVVLVVDASVVKVSGAEVGLVSCIVGFLSAASSLACFSASLSA